MPLLLRTYAGSGGHWNTPEKGKEKTIRVT